MFASTAADRRRRRWALASVLLAAAMLALSACGDADPDPPADRGALASVTRLTSGQRAAIEKVYVAALAFERGGGVTRPRSLRAVDVALSPVLRACGRLDVKDDALLRELFHSCAGEASFLRYAAEISRCTNPDICSEAFSTLRTGLKSMVASDRRADRAVRATGLAPACKSALVTPKSGYDGYRRLDAVLHRIVRALESQSPRDVRSAAASARRFKVKPRPTSVQLATFRSACG